MTGVGRQASGVAYGVAASGIIVVLARTWWVWLVLLLVLVLLGAVGRRSR